MEEKEEEITSLEQLKELLKAHRDDGTLICIFVDKEDTGPQEGDDADG